MKIEPGLCPFWYDFVLWLLGKTEKFPKKIRHTLSNRIDDLALTVLLELSSARYRSEKRLLLDEINDRIDALRLLLRLCHDLTYLDHAGYRYAAEQIDTAGRMLGGWKKQQKAKGLLAHDET